METTSTEEPSQNETAVNQTTEKPNDEEFYEDQPEFDGDAGEGYDSRHSPGRGGFR